MDVLRDRTGVIGGEIVRRHGRQSWILTPFANDRLEQLAGLIIQRDRGPQKVGASLLAAAQIGAVAQTAMNLIQRLPTGDHRCIPRRTLLSRKTYGRRTLGRPAPPASLRLQLKRSTHECEKAARTPSNL